MRVWGGKTGGMAYRKSRAPVHATQHTPNSTAHATQYLVQIDSTRSLCWLCCCDAMLLDCKNTNAYTRYSAKDPYNQSKRRIGRKGNRTKWRGGRCGEREWPQRSVFSSWRRGTHTHTDTQIVCADQDPREKRSYHG